MSSKTVIPKRALIIGGDIVRLPEYAIQDVQNRIRGTGEKLEDAIERIYVEFLNPFFTKARRGARALRKKT